MHPLETALLQEWPSNHRANLRLVVAVSGGADSIALARALHRTRPAESSIIFAHFNHRLRGSESDDDANFVRQFAQSLDCQFKTNPLPEHHSSAKDEATLRQSRYAFLEACCLELGARYLVTAHTADDQIETVLHHFLRGTGLAGLAGMRTFRPSLSTPDLVHARPLLHQTRQQILEYLQSLGQTYRVDSSNLTSDYTRNWLRRELLPQIEERLGSQCREAILQASQHASELQDWLELQAEEAYPKVVLHRSDSVLQLRLPPLQCLPWPVAHSLLRRLWIESKWSLKDTSAAHWTMLRQFILSHPEHRDECLPEMMPGGIQVSRCGRQLILQSFS